MFKIGYKIWFGVYRIGFFFSVGILEVIVRIFYYCCFRKLDLVVVIFIKWNSYGICFLMLLVFKVKFEVGGIDGNSYVIC